MATVPVRISQEFYETAAQAAATMSRSAAQQITHWARLGKAFEDSSEVSTPTIARVLEGSASYDQLSGAEQAVVRRLWEAQFAERREALNLAADFTRDGRVWSELGDDGEVIVHEPTGEVTAGLAGQ